LLSGVEVGDAVAVGDAVVVVVVKRTFFHIPSCLLLYIFFMKCASEI